MQKTVVIRPFPAPIKHSFKRGVVPVEEESSGLQEPLFGSGPFIIHLLFHQRRRRLQIPCQNTLVLELGNNTHTRLVPLQTLAHFPQLLIQS